MAYRRRATPVTKRELIEVKCTFCHGTGRSLFGIQYPLACCSVCRGKGVMMVTKCYITCRACHGTGTQPFSSLTCLACDGRGVISVVEHTETCPVCDGADAENKYCLPGHGGGVIPVKEPAASKGA